MRVLNVYMCMYGFLYRHLHVNGTHPLLLQLHIVTPTCICPPHPHHTLTSQSLSAAAQTTKVKDGKLQGAEYIKGQVNTAKKHVDAAIKGYGT